MRYRLYVNSYERGWEKIICRNIEEVNKQLENLNPYEYGRYIVIKELKDRDEPADCGYIAKPNKNIKLKKKYK